MSSDFSKAKKPTGANYPQYAIDGAGIYATIEPLIDGKLMQRRYLFGIPLISPLTKEKLGAEDLDDFIKRGMARFATDVKSPVQPLVIRRRMPFDPNLYNQHIFMELPDKPVRRFLRFAIVSANYQNATDSEGNLEQDKQFPSGGAIYQIPSEWIDMGNAVRGYININPISPAFTAIGTAQATGAAGATILQFIGQQGWVPAYWQLEYETGLMNADGTLPVIVNEAVGSAAALYAIDLLLPLFRTASQSMSVDNLSQSINDRMIDLMQDKRTVLEARYKEIVKHLKVMFGNNLFSSNV